MQMPNQPRRLPLTQIAHQHLRAAVQQWRGAHGNSSAAPLLAIDATAGNGHDTLFLAELLGSSGEVAAFDIQPQALANTAARLHEHTAASAATAESGGNLQAYKAAEPDAQPTGLAHVRLICASHAQMAGHLPEQWAGQVCIITFNLGYLPGGDKARVTLAESTLPALEAALRLLAHGVLLSVLCYRGHTEGMSETDAIRHWLATVPDNFTHNFISASADAPPHAPLLLQIERKA